MTNAFLIAQYGDGGLIPREYLETAVRIIKETRSLISWTPGDVLLLDVSPNDIRISMLLLPVANDHVCD